MHVSNSKILSKAGQDLGELSMQQNFTGIYEYETQYENVTEIRLEAYIRGKLPPIKPSQQAIYPDFTTTYLLESGEGNKMLAKSNTSIEIRMVSIKDMVVMEDMRINYIESISFDSCVKPIE